MKLSKSARETALRAIACDPVRVFLVDAEGWPVAEYGPPTVSGGVATFDPPRALRSGVAVAVVGRSSVAEELWREPLVVEPAPEVSISGFALCQP